MPKKPPFIVRYGAIGLLRLLGWRAHGDLSQYPAKYVVVAQHTSNWDGVIGVLSAFEIGIRPNWLGKKELFKNPIAGAIVRWAGGIPIDRSSRHNRVEQVIEAFKQADELIVGIAPEGTRKHVEYWRTGFYYIAVGAQVPIVVAHIDYKLKRAWLGELIEPSGDIRADMARIREALANTTPKYPAHAAKIDLPPDYVPPTLTPQPPESP